MVVAVRNNAPPAEFTWIAKPAAAGQTSTRAPIGKVPARPSTVNGAPRPWSTIDFAAVGADGARTRIRTGALGLTVEVVVPW